LRLILIGDRGVNLDLMTDFDLEARGLNFDRPLEIDEPERSLDRCVRLFFAAPDVNPYGDPSIRSLDFFGEEADALRKRLRGEAGSDLMWSPVDPDARKGSEYR
jgi:hypothetical protein